MLAAGVDFVLPDYWGEPGQYDKTRGARSGAEPVCHRRACRR